MAWWGVGSRVWDVKAAGLRPTPHSRIPAPNSPSRITSFPPARVYNPFMDCPPRFHTRRLGWSLACLLLPPLAIASSAHALTPDQIALVVNAKDPAGVKLAQFYAQQR